MQKTNMQRAEGTEHRAMGIGQRVKEKNKKQNVKERAREKKDGAVMTAAFSGRVDHIMLKNHEISAIDAASAGCTASPILKGHQSSFQSPMRIRSPLLFVPSIEAASALHSTSPFRKMVGV